MAAHPGQALNAVALFLALAGAWLLVATRVRELRLAGLSTELRLPFHLATASERVNLFFYRFGGAALVAGAMLSWFSTRLG